MKDIDVNTAESLDGNVYNNGELSVGKGSYHFDLENPYRYYKFAFHNWLRKDGSGLPEFNYFTDHSFDPVTRTFRGTHDWGDNPKVFKNEKDKYKQTYTIIFTPDFHEFEWA